MMPPGPEVQSVENQEPVVQPVPEPVMPPVETQEPVSQPALGPVVPPVETQEPVSQPAPGPVVPPVETQAPVAPPAPGPVAPLVETQAPVVQVPPAVIVPPAPVMQRYVSAIPTEQKPAPKPLKKGVLVAVIIVAILVFLIGVAGAFYFAETGGDSDGGMNQGRQEELEDNTVSHREDIGEYSQLEEADNSDGKKEEGPIDENQSSPWENPIEGNRIPAFSGRDVYPDIDGYAEGKPGDSMHTYWFDYTVTDAYICDEYGGYLPKAGYEVLVVEMAVRNTFDERIPMFDDDFQAQWNDMSDNAYAWPIEDAEFLGEDVLPAYYVLEEDQVIVGLLLFEVPVGYTDFSLAYWEIFDDDTYGDLFFLDFTVDRKQIDITV